MFKDQSKWRKSITLFLVGVISLVGCTIKDKPVISIADQYGLAYAPLEIMKQLQFLEQNIGSDVAVNWVKLSNTTAIREAMLSGDLDVGFMGIPPFLIGLDKGMPWRMMTGLSSSPLGLVVKRASVQDLRGLVGAGKIVLPQPGSIQHILLSMAADRNLGEATLFDNQLLSLKHPDGVQALLTQPEVVAHFTAPPYLSTELSYKEHDLLLTGEEAFGGPFTFIVGVCQADFYSNRRYYEGFLKALDQSLAFIDTHPDETVARLATAYDMEPQEVRRQLYEEGLIFSREIEGVDRFVDFMGETGYITDNINPQDTVWE